MFKRLLLLGGCWVAMPAWSQSINWLGAITDVFENIAAINTVIQETTPEARAPGALVTMKTEIDDNGVQTATVAYDPRLQRQLVRNPRDPRHPTVANDVSTYALAQGTLYNNQP